MNEAAWKDMERPAVVGLAKALSDGRGVDALAMLEAIERVRNGLQRERRMELQMGMMNAQRGAP